MTDLKRRIHDYIDGELDLREQQLLEQRCEHDPELRAALHQAIELRDDLGAVLAPPEPSSDLGDRIMRQVRIRPVPVPSAPWWSVFVQPLRVPMWAAAAATMVFAGVAGWGLVRQPTPTEIAVVPAGGAAQVALQPASHVVNGGEACGDRGTVVPVRFWLNARDAKQVSLVGDFNDWKAGSAVAVDPDANGVWTVTIDLKPGRYQYSFVVDGQVVTDPDAATYADDGFGGRNAVLTL